MAFKEVYARLVEQARRQRMPVSWQVSEGFDKERRAAAITAAVHAGRLPMSELPQLPAPDRPLLTLAESKGIPEHARQALLKLGASLKARMEAPSADAQARADTSQRKAETAERVRAYGAGA